MKYLRPFLTIAAFFLVLLIILSVEQVYGGPILYLALATLWLEKRSSWVQLVVILLLASAVATVYLIAYSLSFLLMSGCVILFGQLRTKLASQTGALLIASLIVGLGFSILSQIVLTWTFVLSVLISLGLVIGVSKITLTPPPKRYHL